MERRRAIVEVRFGRMAGHKAVIDPGGVLVVGRTERAGLSIVGDAQMSGTHFELMWDGESCRMRDLGSATGTQLRGLPVQEADVPHGGWIRAGQTDFMVYYEAYTPPRPVVEDGPGETVEDALGREGALGGLRDEAARGTLYAVLDAARDERVLELVRESVQPYRSLYEGVKGEALSDVAPHLVAFDADAPLLDALVWEGWGKRWGIWLSSPQAFADVRRHLRRFLMVEDDETGEKLYFRYYDPRVLRAFVPSCTARQRAAFFGEIEAFFVEGRRGELFKLARNDSSTTTLSALGAA